MWLNSKQNERMTAFSEICCLRKPRKFSDLFVNTYKTNKNILILTKQKIFSFGYNSETNVNFTKNESYRIYVSSEV